MTPRELIAAGRALYGRHWKSALGRTVGRERTTILRYSTGKRRIPAGIAAEIRSMMNIGQAERVIHNTVRKIAPGIRPFVAHTIARQVLVDLRSFGMLKGNAAPGDLP